MRRFHHKKNLCNFSMVKVQLSHFTFSGYCGLSLYRHISNVQRYLDSLEGVRAKNVEATLLFDSIDKGKMEQILQAHHHHHVTPPARISLTLSRHPSLSCIAPGRSSRLHLVSALSCCIQVLACRPAFARPCEGVHWSILL